MAEMVQTLTLEGNVGGAFKEYTVDTRGVFGTVTIDCNKKNSCNEMTVYFQQYQDYVYTYSGKDTSTYHYGTPTINIKCATGACKDLLLIRLDDPEGPKREKATKINMNGVEVWPTLDDWVETRIDNVGSATTPSVCHFRLDVLMLKLANSHSYFFKKLL